MIHTGDAIEVMRGMPEASVDAVVTDPPYGIRFMGKAWDRPDIDALVANRREAWEKRERKGGSPASTGIGSPAAAAGTYDLSIRAMRAFQAWCEAWGREALRVIVPGGYLLAFGGTRTHHRLVCGLEDAGWIIRDELDWIYASGFPKGKANLKPAHEPIVLARKPGPLRPLAIDACRIEIPDGEPNIRTTPTPSTGTSMFGVSGHNGQNLVGRWPFNVLLQDAELFDVANPEVVGSGAVSLSAGMYRDPGTPKERGARGGGDGEGFLGGMIEGSLRDNTYANEVGGYSRFFIIPKADRADREPVLRGQLEEQEFSSIADGTGINRPEARLARGVSPTTPSRENAHPTVKPVDLMRHLVRLVTPSRNEDGEPGLILDPFLGSGSTAIAAEMEGFRWIGIEQSAEYVAIAEARLNGVQKGLGLDVPAPTRKRASKWDDNATAKRHQTEIRDPYAFWGERERPPRMLPSDEEAV